MNAYSSGMKNWLDSMRWQTEFALRSSGARREDGERNWTWYEEAVSYSKQWARRHFPKLLAVLGRKSRCGTTVEWLHDHSNDLWETRSILADDLNRLPFDSSLLCT